MWPFVTRTIFWSATTVNTVTMDSPLDAEVPTTSAISVDFNFLYLSFILRVCC